MSDTVIATLADALQIDAALISEDDTYETLPRWDSLRRIMLANLIEQNFSIGLRNQEIAELTSVANIRAVLARHEGKSSTTGAPEKSKVAEIFETASMLADADFQASWSGPSVRVAIVAALTPDFVAAAIASSIWSTGVLPILHVAPFGTYIQELVDGQSGLYRFAPEVVVLFPDVRGDLPTIVAGETDEAVAAALDGIVADHQTHWQRLKDALGCAIIQHLYVPPIHNGRGFAERRLASTPRRLVEDLNDRLVAAGAGSVSWLETDRLAAVHGLANWASPSYYFNAKMPFDPRFLPEYAQAFGGVWRSLRAQTRKVLVLDLDNTVWGGVIGDDGVEGIKLGPDTPTGEAFTAWGDYVRGLAQRGVILAVCSKNSRHLALTGFDHPHSPLKANDFAAMEISWDDKATGLRRIAQTLNVGIDSLVFVDDNPFECDLVRQNVPEVAVIHLGDEPDQFPARLDAGHWFDLQELTREDLQRASSYRARATAMAEQRVAVNIEAYLDGLEMVGSLYEAPAGDVARLAQMEQKTNQFNLTTRRFSADDIAHYRADPDGMVLSFTLKDRHADHGLVSSMIGRIEGATFHIDNWLMSCRVFSRTAEHFILRELAALVRARGVTRVAATFVPTAKNGVLAEILPKLGFVEAADRWTRALDANLPDTHVLTPTEAADGRSNAPAAASATTVADAQTLDAIRTLMDSGALDEADARLSAATAACPGDVRLAILDAQLTFKRRGWPAAARSWVAAETRFKDTIDLYVPFVDALREATQHREMDRVIDAGIARFPYNRDLRHRRALGALVRGDLAATATYWLEAYQVDPTWEPPITGAIEALTRIGRLDEASAFLSENRDRVANTALLTLLEAELLVARREYAEVPPMLLALQFKAPADLGIMIRISDMYSAMEMPDLAIAALDRAQDAGGDRGTLDLYRSLLFRKQGAWRRSFDTARASAAAGVVNGTIFDLAKQSRTHLPAIARKSVVIYGSCQAAALSSIMTDILSIDEDVDIIPVLGHDDRYFSAIDREALSRATIYWEQSDDRDVVPMRDALREALPAGCQRYTFPALTMFGLWPFDTPEPFRNVSEPDYHVGRFPYGDSVALKVAAEGLTGYAGVDRYHELSAKLMPNLDNLFSRDLDMIRARDARSDFAMASFIEQNVGQLHMFASWGHVFLPAAHELARNLLNLSQQELGIADDYIRRSLDSVTPWIDNIQVPVHPLVIDHFRIRFLNASSTYVWQGQRWTHDEYVRNYIDRTTDW